MPFRSASLHLCLGILVASGFSAHLSAGSAVEVPLVNPGFETGTNPDADDWTRVDGAEPNSSPSNYAEQIPGLTSRTMQLKSDGGNHVQQSLLQDVGGNAIDAARFGFWTVGFQYGYRRDAVTEGDHVIRVSLWNTRDDVELAGQDLLIADPGSAGANTLDQTAIVLGYNHTDPALADAGVALRFTSTSSNLGGNAWRRTAVLDDVTLSASAEAPDPRLIAATSLHVTSEGEEVDFVLPATNGGATQVLEITSALISGPDAARFSVTSIPATIAPGETGDIILSFQPDGLANDFFATLTILSNDSGGMPHVVQLTAFVDDPEIAYRLWALSYGLDPDGDGARHADPDGDGLPNEEEYLLGSDPTDPSDPDGRDWMARPGKAALMVFSAHPDDEGIFFGGALPYYTQVRRLPTILVSVTSGDWVLAPEVREQETRDAAWVYGLRNHPVFLRFPDAPFSSLDQNFNSWGGGQGAEAGRRTTALEFARVIRRYRPDVVLTHDFGGEYGHMNHRAVAFATVDAVELAADPDEMIGGLEPWQVKKVYVNLYDGAPLFHDFWEDGTIDTTGNGIPDRSPREVANLGLAEHKTQNNGNFRVVSVYHPGANPGFNWDSYPSEHWGLHSSTVGPDSVAADFTIMGQTYSGWASGDFFENLTVFPDLDGDGLADDWELAWFPSLEAADPDDDVSGDGFTNLEAFILGLNPLVPGRVEQAMEKEGFVFHLPAAEGTGYEGLSREFEVLFSTDLVDWDVVHQGTADGEEWLIEPPPDSQRGFFRLNVSIR